MAETRDEDLVLQPADAGAAFRMEMAASNFLLGYWKHMVAALVAVLVSVLIYGQYNSYVHRQQRGTAAEIAAVERDLPAPIAILGFQKSQGMLTSTPEQLEAAADRLEAIGAEASGAASVEARLKAAELYRLAGSPKRRTTLEAAAGTADDVLRYAAVSGLAAMDLEEGNGDQAVARYKELMSSKDAFLAQQAAIELGLALEHLGRKDEAAQVYAEFLTRWPDAPRAGEVKDRQGQVGASG